MTTNGTIGPCEGTYGTRRTFMLEGVSVVLHDMVMDKQLRYMIDWGESFNNAYGKIGMWDDIPPQGMRTCCHDVLRTKWFDPLTGTWKRSGWGHTCAGYFHCFEDYVAGLRDTGQRGRIRIAPGVYAPSPEEERCIKLRYHASQDIGKAYNECGAIDILPTFPGAAAGLSKLMSTIIGSPMYEMIKTVHAITALGEPHQPHHTPPEPETPNYWLYAGVAVGAVLLLRK